MTAQFRMFQGCTSDAGKSFLTAVYCRWLKNQGVKVAPFKAQNMSLNSAVTKDGREIGRAQWLQALAAGVGPTHHMNPVLIKPLSDTRAQTLVHGRPFLPAEGMAWHDRKTVLWPFVQESLSALKREYEVVVVEGAGSPAEVNLRHSDIVNMSVALESKAKVAVIADIDRGGSYAHLLGTFLCLNELEKQHVKGFVLNKFRGDESLLAPANTWLFERTGVAVQAVIPWRTHRLPEEDRVPAHRSSHGQSVRVGMVLYPYASNTDEWDPLFHHPNVSVTVVHGPWEKGRFDAVILPGTRNTAASLQAVMDSQMSACIKRDAEEGVVIWGVCGGLQILGCAAEDPEGVEQGPYKGLGLLPLTTTYRTEKTLRNALYRLEGVKEPLEGYEIHHGTSLPSDHRVEAWCWDSDGEALGWRQDNVFGTYIHGLLSSEKAMSYFLKRAGLKTPQTWDWQNAIECDLERLSQDWGSALHKCFGL